MNVRVEPFIARLIFTAVIVVGGAVWFSGILSTMNCREMTAGMRSMHTEEVSLLDDRGKMFTFQSRVADDHTERAAGYQYICSHIIDVSTLLFVYPRPTLARFHMNNVVAPLDIGFFDDQGKLFSIMQMQPRNDGNARLYGPAQPFQYALEAGQGFFAERNLSAGKSRLIIGKLYDSR